MRFKRILLVNPPYSGNRVKVVFCAGLGYVAESLEKEGFEYGVLDMSLGYKYKDLKKRIENFCPDLIGISIMTYRYKETYGIIEQVKKDFPEIHIVAGGPHVSAFRNEVLEGCSAIDHGIVLEGELTLVDLCKGIPLPAIKGLIFRDNSSIIYNGDRAFIEDIDNIPFPKYSKFELDRSINKDINSLSIITSRGCPFDCIYCTVKFTIGKRFRIRSPENIMGELIYWYNRGYRRFSFADDNFTLIKERVYNLCKLIKEQNLKDLRLSCDNGIRADKVDRDLLKFMREVGFYRIALGVEAGNNRILKILKKQEHIEIIKKAIENACDLGYEVDLFFLTGTPGETWQDLEDSFKIALDYPISIAHFYNIIPFPNSEMFELIKTRGRFLKEPKEYLNNYPILDNEPLFETPELSKKERKRALRHAFGIMKRTTCRTWIKRMGHYGLLGKLSASVYATGLVQDRLLRNNRFKKILYRLTKGLFK